MLICVLEDGLSDDAFEHFALGTSEGYVSPTSDNLSTASFGMFAVLKKIGMDPSFNDVSKTSD